MTINLLICSVLFALFIICSITFFVINKKIGVKFALVWMILFTLLLISILIPGFLEGLTDLLGFLTPSNMVISVFVAILVVINISLTIVISKHSKKIVKLTQEIAILQNEDENKKIS